MANTAANRQRTAEIRKWASAGFDVADRGRISSDVVEACEARSDVEQAKVSKAKKKSKVPTDPFATVS